MQKTLMDDDENDDINEKLKLWFCFFRHKKFKCSNCKINLKFKNEMKLIEILKYYM